jgi:hypothetical protein
MPNEPRNPYAAPATQLRREGLRAPAPGAIRLGVGLYLLGFAILQAVFLISANGSSPITQEEADFPYVLGLAIAMLLNCIPLWLLWKATKGSAGARNALVLLMTLVLAAVLISSIPQALKWTTSTITVVAGSLLQILGLGLLFTRRANRWYGRRRGT